VVVEQAVLARHLQMISSGHGEGLARSARRSSGGFLLHLLAAG